MITSEIDKLSIKKGTEFQELCLLRLFPEWSEIVKSGSFDVIHVNNQRCKSFPDFSK
jgi:hypothetical protein